MGNAIPYAIPFVFDLITPWISQIFKKSKDPRPIHAPSEQELPRPDWLTPGMNWAVCGSSGVGKSSLINKIRGLRANSPGAAPVGVVETTVKPTPYSFPDQPNLKLWDLPGGATVKFPADKYVVEFGLRHMSGVILVTATRASHLDVEILNVLNHYKVPWYYVRSKADVDVENNLNDFGIDANETINTIKTNLVENMRTAQGGANLPSSRVFVISNRLSAQIGHWREFAACIAADLRVAYEPLINGR